MNTSKIRTLALIAPAMVAATIALPATAHASNSYQFQSPSGNVGCEMWEQDGTFSAVCQLRDHTWAAPPPSGDCHYGGYDLKLLRGGMPCAGVWPGGEIWLLQQSNELPTLAYGQTHTVGTITCDSEPSGVTCTDSSTGHFFRVSRDSYELG
jgi:hypothetical protein